MEIKVKRITIASKTMSQLFQQINIGLIHLLEIMNRLGGGGGGR